MFEKSTENIIALVPAYNEAKKIAGVVKATKPYLPVWVIDDGSADDTAAAAEDAGAVVIRQEPNQGKGMALKRGFQLALDAGVDAVVTLDADGQHDPAEIPLFLEAFQKHGSALIIGWRNFRQMPIQRRIANTLGSVLMSWALKSRIVDDQSGYRLIGKDLMKAAMCSPLPGYEFEVDMLRICLQHGWVIDWVPIKTIYADEVSSIQPVKHVIQFVKLVLAIRKKRINNQILDHKK